MSAFLGPVHHWMYGKIQLQEALTARLLALSPDPALAGRLEESYGPADTQPLEAIIDQTGIHGWLDGRVRRAETRFADAVEALLDGVSLEALAQVAHALGEEHPVPSGTDLATAYQALDSVLLDGMPCDGGRQVLSQDNDTLTFQYSPQLHPLYTRDERGAAAFTALREALLVGMLAGAGLALESLGQGTYRLKREG